MRSATHGEFRDATAEVPPRFGGHAAVFNRRTWIGPKRAGFWEQVAPGAFDRSLREADVKFLYNHDEAAVLATTASGTLRLAEDQRGLLTDADLDPTDIDAQRVIPKLRSGKLSSMSFAFEPITDEWQTLEDGTELRTLGELKLWDVSVVTFPAYNDTDAGLRSQAFTMFFRDLGVSAERQRSLARQITDGVPLDQIPDLRSITPEPGSSTQDVAPVEPGSSTRGVPLADLRRRHALTASKFGIPAA